MKKITLFFAALFCVTAVSAKTIYCKMEQSWWKADGAAVGCYYWEGGTPSWPGIRMTAVENETDLWSIDIPEETTTVIFTRVNGSGTISDWGAQTANLTVPTDGKNLFTITTSTATWGDNPGCNGEWSTYGVTNEPSVSITITGDLKPGATVTLSASTENIEGTVTYAYSVEFEGVSTNIEGTSYTFEEDGTYIFTITASVDGEVKATNTKTVSVLYDWYLKGSFNGWNNDNPMTQNGDEYVTTITLAAGEYELKLSGSEWLGVSSLGTVSGATTSGTDNIIMNLTAESDVTFTLTADKKINISAVAHQVTAIDQVEATVIYANAGRIYGAEGARIYTISGLDVTEMNGQLNGIYVVRTQNAAYKVAVK